MSMNTTHERMPLKIIRTCDTVGRLKVIAILIVVMLKQPQFYLESVLEHVTGDRNTGTCCM